MTISNDCVRAEITAGAVALGEASDAERDAYRRHLSACRHCVATLGGERDIERTMQLVVQARDAETWTPDPRPISFDTRRVGRYVWPAGLAAAAAVALIVAGARAFIPSPPESNVRQVAIARKAATIVPAHPAARAVAGHDLVVLHNVVTLKRPPLVVAAQSHAARMAPPAGFAAPHKQPGVAAAPAVVAAAPPSQREERSVAALRTVGTSAPAPQGAESIAVLPQTTVVHDVVPLGGENAISPHPLAIAYYENAEGTTAFEVNVDERGVPEKCSITKSSGYVVLDEAVCRAAMRVHYSPRTVNGRAVSSIYRDAFTFRSGDDQ